MEKAFKEQMAKVQKEVDGLGSLFEGLGYAGFNPPELRHQIIKETSTSPSDVLKIIVAYFQIGNSPGRLLDASKVKELAKAKEVAQILQRYNVKKGKGAGTATPSQVAQCFMPLTLLLGIQFSRLDDPVFAPLFSHIPAYMEKKKNFDAGLAAFRASKLKQGEVERKSTVDYTALQIDGMLSDLEMSYYLLAVVRTGFRVQTLSAFTSMLVGSRKFVDNIFDPTIVVNFKIENGIGSGFYDFRRDAPVFTKLYNDTMSAPADKGPPPTPPPSTTPPAETTGK